MGDDIRYEGQTEQVIEETLGTKTIDLKFLKSTAFYAINLGAISAVLIDPTLSTSSWYVTLGKFIGIISAGFWGTRTLDRTVDKMSK